MSLYIFPSIKFLLSELVLADELTFFDTHIQIACQLLNLLNLSKSGRCSQDGRAEEHITDSWFLLFLSQTQKILGWVLNRNLPAHYKMPMPSLSFLSSLFYPLRMANSANIGSWGGQLWVGVNWEARIVLGEA